MKRLLNCIPALCATLIAACATVGILGNNGVFIDLALILLALFDLWLIASIYVAPYDEKWEFVLELLPTLSLGIYIPGTTAQFITMIPYSTPFLLLPLLSFILTAIVLSVKYKHLRRIEKDGEE